VRPRLLCSGAGGRGGAGADEFGRAAGVIAGLERDLAGGLDPAAADLLWRGLRAVTERAEAVARETGSRAGRRRVLPSAG
jgi:hypothetical protein